MSNHFHLDALALSDQTVIDRWAKLSEKPDDHADPHKRKSKPKSKLEKVFEVPELRERLYSIPWFVKCFKEHISRLANVEDDCKGFFWESRCKSPALLKKGVLVV